MQATYLLTPEDFREGFATYQKSYVNYVTCAPGTPYVRHVRITAPTPAQSRRKQLLLAAFPIVLVAAVVIGMFSISLTHESKADPADAGAVWRERLLRFGYPVFILVLVIGTIFYTRRKAQRSAQANMETQQECALEVFESGLRITQTAAVYNHQWSAFRILAESENLFVMQMTESSFLIIPKRAFAGAADIDAFRTLVVEKLTPKEDETRPIEAKADAQNIPATPALQSDARFAFRVKITPKELREALSANNIVRKMGPLTKPAPNLHAPPIIDLTRMNRTRWLGILGKYYWIPVIACLLLWQAIDTIQKGGFGALWKRLGEMSATAYVIAGAVTGMILFSMIQMGKAIRREAEKLPEQLYEVRDDGIQVTAASIVYLQWFALKRAAETPALFLVYSDENTCMMIPKRCFTDKSQADAFRELLAAKIGNRALGAFPVEAAQAQPPALQ